MKRYPLTQWPELYADYVNNFLTVQYFANYYGISVDHAEDIVELGRLTDNFSKAVKL